jgi:hypothetical protein
MDEWMAKWKEVSPKATRNTKGYMPSFQYIEGMNVLKEWFEGESDSELSVAAATVILAHPQQYLNPMDEGRAKDILFNWLKQYVPQEKASALTIFILQQVIRYRLNSDEWVAYASTEIVRLDAVMNVKPGNSGGIDFKVKDLQMNTRTLPGSVQVDLIDPAMLAQFQSPHFMGVEATIIRITPINGAAELLGVVTSNKLCKFD